MAVPFAPPLRSGVGARGDRHRLAARRRRGEVLRRVAIGGDRHRRAAVRAHAVDVEHARDLVAVGLEEHRLAVRRPSGHQLVRIVERQPRDVTGRERQHVDVAVAGAGRGEREPFAVGREQRARLGRRMRHEQPRVAAAGGHLPDVAAADERDRRAVGRNARLGKRRQRGNGGALRLRDRRAKALRHIRHHERRTSSSNKQLFHVDHRRVREDPPYSSP